MSLTVRLLVLLGAGALFGLTLASCTPPAGSDPVVDVAAGTYHTCAVRRSGKVLCWGFNGDGQLGNGSLSSSLTPTPLPAFTDATAIASGDSFSCAIHRTVGTVSCWGDNQYGQLGNGLLTNSNVPVPVSGLANAIAITAGEFHACALITGGAIQCWGYNNDGQLGNNSTTDSSTPVPVVGSPVWTAVSAGGEDTCAIDNSSHAACWGNNVVGQLGSGLDPSTFDHQAVPFFDVNAGLAGPPLAPVSSIGVGGNHTCAVANNQGYCWGGEKYGQLGNGVTAPTYSTFAVPVTGLTTAANIASGGEFSCSTLAFGGVNCWGENTSGDLGNNSLVDSSTPVLTSGLTSISKVSLGASHACGVRSDGTVSCWGWNVFGQIGNGNTTDQHTPVQVL
jgi:alpha-tubulin suppressor-like RCC1 family protein